MTKKSIPARGKLVNMWRNRVYENKKSEKQIDIRTDPEDNNSEEGKVIVRKNMLELMNYYKSVYHLNKSVILFLNLVNNVESFWLFLMCLFKLTFLKQNLK